MLKVLFTVALGVGWTAVLPPDAQPAFRPHVPDPDPVDGRVINVTHDPDGTLVIMIGAKPVDADLVKKDWTGVFLSDGKELPGTDFKLTEVHDRRIWAKIAVQKLPSERVRLFPAGSRH